MTEEDGLGYLNSIDLTDLSDSGAELPGMGDGGEGIG